MKMPSPSNLDEVMTRLKRARTLGGILYILLFYLLGTVLSSWTGHLVPGSVIGMLLLFFALLSGIIKPDAVKAVARLLTSWMSLFFIPAGVGVMVYWNVLDENKFIIVAACVVSTIIIIATVGWIQEFFEKRVHRG
jgi:holin-like protein